MYYASMNYERRDLFMKCMAFLYSENPRVARVVYLRTKYGLTYREIGKELGLSTNYVYWMEGRGLGMLRFHMKRILRVKKESALAQEEFVL